MSKPSGRGVVLFSGGIDSTTALYWALNQYQDVSALTIDYGQRHCVEIQSGRKLLDKLGIETALLRLDLTQIGGSSLTDTDLPLPRFDARDRLDGEHPSTYVPFRNGIFLSLAAAWAEVNGRNHIICGFNVIDSPDYPDTRKPFVNAMEEALNAGTRASRRRPFKILAPFIDKKKSEIIRTGLSLGADYAYSISCYSGSEIPCGLCSSCLLRREAWQEAGHEDPLILRLKKEGRI